jgi:two-component system OmpR family response regulator
MNAKNESKFKAVLLVDDDRDLVGALQSALISDDFLVDVAYDGQEASLKVKIQQYDAIVCDLMMPKLRGDEFYQQVVAQRPELAARFLFITGHATDDQIVRRFLSTVPARYLLKPFSVQELIEAVRNLVS